MRYMPGVCVRLATIRYEFMMVFYDNCYQVVQQRIAELANGEEVIQNESQFGHPLRKFEDADRFLGDCIHYYAT